MLVSTPLLKKTTFRTIHNNNFNALRLLAALLVLVSHSYTLLKRDDPLLHFNTNLSLGGFSVAVFFILSGFLIYKSRVKNTIFHFFENRILRLFPGLFVCLCISFFLVYPFFTKFSIQEYFTNPDVWDSFGRSLFLLFERFGFVIKGFFPDNFVPEIYNGSLWSLPLEFSMYCLLGALIWKNSKKWLNFLLLSFLYIIFQFGIPIYLLDPVYHPVTWVGNIVEATVIFKTLHLNDVVYFGSYFMAGSLIANILDKRKLPHYIGITALILGVYLSVTSGMNNFQWQIPLLSLGVIYVGSLNWDFLTKKLAIIGDLSYGIYIYGFVVHQVIIFEAIKYHVQLRPVILFGATILILIPIAYLSWRYIENPFLKAKTIKNS